MITALKRTNKLKGTNKYLMEINLLRVENNFLRVKIEFLENNHFGEIKESEV